MGAITSQLRPADPPPPPPPVIPFAASPPGVSSAFRLTAIVHPLECALPEGPRTGQAISGNVEQEYGVRQRGHRDAWHADGTECLTAPRPPV